MVESPFLKVFKICVDVVPGDVNGEYGFMVNMAILVEWLCSVILEGFFDLNDSVTPWFSVPCCSALEAELSRSAGHGHELPPLPAARTPGTGSARAVGAKL